MYSLTFDDFQSSLGGKGCGLMNTDELLRNSWTAEETQAKASVCGSVQGEVPSESFNLQRQGSFEWMNLDDLLRNNFTAEETQATASFCDSAQGGVPPENFNLRRRTVDEVWKYLLGESGRDGAKHGSGISGSHFLKRQKSLGEMTLEEFLVRAGVVRETIGSIAVTVVDISQGQGMNVEDAARNPKGNQSTLKYARQEYGIHKFPPRKLISQSHPNETLELVDHEGIAQLNSDNVPFDHALGANVDTNSDVVKEIPAPLFLPTAQQENLDEDAGNDEVEAVGMGVDGAGGGEMEEGQLDSRYLGKGKKNEMTPKGEKRSKKTTGVRIDIPFEDILLTKRMLLKDAAKHLKVSRSTMKRVCRDYNIHRWPPREEHKLIGQSPTNKSPPVVDKERIRNLNSDKLLRSNQVSASIDTNSVTVKARYGKVTIKFQLSWPWGMVELEQQVKKRLKLEAETCYINYKDEDNELILLACDEDLQDYISRSTLLGTSSIEVFLEPK